MKHVFILNPKAGKKDNHLAHEIMIKSHFTKYPSEYEIHVTEYAGHAAELAKKACEQNDAVRIYAFGGDGTFNEVVSGSMGFDNCAVGIYPCGTGNDFVKTLGGSKLPTIKELTEGTETVCDIMQTNGKTGINICSTGFDSEAAKNVQKFKRFLTGSLAYTASLFYCFLTKIKFDLSVTIDGKNYDGSYIIVVAANGRYYGGGYCPAPEASISDGLLDFVLIKSVSRIKILQLLGKFKKGRHTELDITKVIRGKKIDIKCKKPLQLNIDGEVETVNEISIELLPAKLRLICPT